MHSIYLKYPRVEESLQDHTDKKTPIEEKKINKWFCQLILSVEHMHEQGITHRDIKPGNIFLDFEGQVLLADFGISKYLGNEEKKVITENRILGAIKYMAPEVKSGNSQINWYKEDVCSLGIVLLELYSRTKQQVKEIEIEDWLKKTQEIITDKKLAGVLKKMLNFNAKERPSLKEIRAEIESSFSEIFRVN